MNRSRTLPVWLWFLQALTGAFLVVYVIVHTIDNATILISIELYEEMLSFWHETIWSWFYLLMVLGLILFFLVHMFNGIRIASKPYRDIEVSWKHNLMLKHSGTYYWFAQVISGSAIAIFGVWHLLVQHGNTATVAVEQSAMRVTPVIFVIYVLFIASLMFHSFNGVRSIAIKLGFMTDKSREAILTGIMALFFIIFFFLGVLSIAKFLPSLT